MEPSIEPLTPHTDLSGLAVHDADDLLAGHVFGVLTETETGLLRFLDVEIDGHKRHILVPVGHARLEESVTGPRIRLRAARLDDLENVPPYVPDKDRPDGAYARSLLATHGKFFRGDNYYAHPAFDHRGKYAGTHPIVAVGSPDELAAEPLIRLNDSRFRVARGETDVRGWPLRDGEGAIAGVFTDLIADTDTMKVRYGVVETDGIERLLPIGYVDTDEAARQMVAPGLTARDLRVLPPFEGLPLTRLDEERMLDAVERALDARNPFLRVDFSDRDLVTQQRKT